MWSSTEINRTDAFAFKRELQLIDRAVERVVDVLSTALERAEPPADGPKSGEVMLNLFSVSEAGLWLAVVIAVVLCAGLLLPFLFEEIKRGKVELGPRVPTGAGDTHPGYAEMTTPAVPAPHAPPHDATLSLNSFHLVLIWLSIVLASGTGAWALSNHQLWLGLVSLCGAIGLVAYVGYFVSREKRSTSRTSGSVRLRRFATTA